MSTQARIAWHLDSTLAGFCSCGVDKAGADSPGPFEQTERQLVRRVSNGELHLFHELIRPYEREVYRVVCSVVRNPADAEEVAQETFLKAMTRIHQLRSLDRFGPWLFQVAINEARMRKRKYRRSLHDSFDSTPDDDGACSSLAERWPDHRPLPSDVLEQEELKRSLAAALASLPPIYREVCILHHIEELPSTVTSALLGISVSAVKTRAHRARARLKEQLQSYANPALS